MLFSVFNQCEHLLSAQDTVWEKIVYLLMLGLSERENPLEWKIEQRTHT